MKNNKKRQVFRTKKPSFLRRFFKLSLNIIISLVVIVGAAVYFILNASLPQYSGSTRVNGVQSPVTLNRDDLGTLEIIADNRLDAAFALGFSHAQERFFQMDLLRRSAAGELSAIIGPATLNLDRRNRLHRFRYRAEQVINQLPAQQRQLLATYTAGVNQGLAQLSTSPFEYWLLNSTPELWQIEDSVLVVYAMYLDLQDSRGLREQKLQQLFAATPSTLFRQLIPNRSIFDAPIDAAPIDTTPIDITPTDTEQSVVPERPINESKTESTATGTQPETTNRIKHKDTATIDRDNHVDPDQNNGSNNFAIAGARSQYSAAIVAGDMHLGHAVPNIWYKVNLHIKDAKQPRSLYGVTLPGTPLLIAGTNNQIAWTFTNSYGDYSDSVELTIDSEKPHQYRYQNAQHNFVFVKETIKVKGAEDVVLTIKESILGPVIESAPNAPYAFVWVAHHPQAVNLNLLQLETASSVEQAIAIAQTAAIPAQNFLVGDADGNIGWTIIGPLVERRTEANPFTTIALENGTVKWLAPSEYPKVINHPDNALWTANNRIVSNDALTLVGDGGYALASRAFAIREQLLPLENASEQDLLDIQLSTRSPVYDFWRKHLQQVKQHGGDWNEQQLAFFDFVSQWNGHSDADQVGFTLLYYYRYEMRKRLLDQRAAKLFGDDVSSYGWLARQYETRLRQLVTEQPASELNSEFNSYQELYIAAINDIIATLTADNAVLADQTWGKFNRLNIQHPISQAVPWLSSWLDRPNLAMPGDPLSPRVQRSSFGASQRLVMSPGHVENAIFHMPGGQSGHPLSPYYEAGFQDWVEGRPSPLKIKTVEQQLVLTPE